MMMLCQEKTKSRTQLYLAFGPLLGSTLVEPWDRGLDLGSTLVEPWSRGCDLGVTFPELEGRGFDLGWTSPEPLRF